MKRSSKISNCLAVAFTISAGRTGLAQEKGGNPYVWRPKTMSVAVFKNGIGFFIGEGEVGLRDGWCVGRKIPPAVFGTLAIYSHTSGEIVDIIGSGPGKVVEFDGQDAADDPDARRAALGASTSLDVQLTYTHRGAQRTAAGRLVSVGPDFAILESEQNTLAVPIAGVSRLQVLDMPLRVHIASDSEAQPERATLGMAYLAKGITWVPEYTLRVLDDRNAELTLRGTLVNEAEDLIRGDVQFVVGVPHFVHTDYLTPIAVGQMIRTIAAAVAPVQIHAQIMNRAAIAAHKSRADAGREVVEKAIDTGSADMKKALGNLPQMCNPTGDYTVYLKEDITVRRGEKAIVTLFRKKIKYSHVYRWSPPARMQHLLALQNSTDTAWTTGPCLVISGNRPLSEDLLKYVPKGGTGEIPVATAINIAHEKSESEIARKLKAHSPRSNFYLDLVTLQGGLLLKNFAKHKAPIIISVSVPGKPTEATHDGLTRSDPSRLQLTRRCGTIRWKIELAPGKKIKLNYSYKRYVSSH